MAEGGVPANFHDRQFDDNLQEQRDEILALESIYSGGCGEHVDVLSSPDDDVDSLFSLQLTVPVKSEANKITVTIWQSIQEASGWQESGEVTPSSSDIKPPDKTSGVNFKRSDSGRRWICAFEVKHLLPLNLQVTFPPTYPAASPPFFSLSAVWLNATQLSILCKQLDMLWDQSYGMPIIYTWMDWLVNNALNHLGITDSVILIPDADVDEDSDPRAIPECSDLGRNITEMLQYGKQQENIAFNLETHECHVCYDEKMGTQFYRMQTCPHHFCHECMTAYCEMHVKDGTVEELKCPDTDCKETVPPHVVQAVLPPEAYERWERLLLQKTLDRMSDIVWCPRCNSAVIREEGEYENLACCTTCFFAFCTECQELWHQGQECATVEDKLKNLKRQPRKGSEGTKAAEVLRKLEEEAESSKQIKTNYVSCPRCRTRVDKIDGCNKMTCRCGQGFCWACGKAIKDYSHFSISTVCGIGRNDVARPEVAALLIEARLIHDPENHLEVINCPTCRHRNLRHEHNNHMKCRRCNGNFCFMCKKKIVGDITSHFRPPNPCKQHS